MRWSGWHTSRSCGRWTITTHQLTILITSNLDTREMTGQLHERIVKHPCALVEVSEQPMRELTVQVQREHYGR